MSEMFIAVWAGPREAVGGSYEPGRKGTSANVGSGGSGVGSPGLSRTSVTSPTVLSPGSVVGETGVSWGSVDGDKGCFSSVGLVGVDDNDESESESDIGDPGILDATTGGMTSLSDVIKGVLGCMSETPNSIDSLVSIIDHSSPTIMAGLGVGGIDIGRGTCAADTTSWSSICEVRKRLTVGWVKGLKRVSTSFGSIGDLAVS